eukprot:295030-Chlamydomonas_euryale.AAC.5
MVEGYVLDLWELVCRVCWHGNVWYTFVDQLGQQSTQHLLAICVSDGAEMHCLSPEVQALGLFPSVPFVLWSTDWGLTRCEQMPAWLRHPCVRFIDAACVPFSTSLVQAQYADDSQHKSRCTAGQMSAPSDPACKLPSFSQTVFGTHVHTCGPPALNRPALHAPWPPFSHPK